MENLIEFIKIPDKIIKNYKKIKRKNIICMDNLRCTVKFYVRHDKESATMIYN